MGLLFNIFKRPTLNKKLQVAVTQGDSQTARSLIEQGASANQTVIDSDNYLGKSLLDRAVAANDAELVKALLTGKPDLETQTGSAAMSPLGEAALEGYAGLVNLLLARGASPLTPSRGEERLSPLLQALQHDNQAMAQAMLAKIDSLDMESNHDLFCLETAIAKARADNVVNLLSKCPDESRRYLLSKIWMAHAAARGRTSVVRAILDTGIDYNLATELRKEGGPGLDQVVEEMGHREVAALLRERDSGRTVSPQPDISQIEDGPMESELRLSEGPTLTAPAFVERMSTHRDRIDHASPDHRPFTAEHFDDDLLSTLSELAADKMHLSQTDNAVHSISISTSDASYAIYTMPMGLAQAGKWYANEYGGYMPFLNRMSEVPAISSGNPSLLVHLIFGQAPDDEDLWFTMSVLPVDSQRHSFRPLLATDLLTPNEMDDLSNKMSSH